ncbi:alpha/beta hydrolase family protein [Terriglobus aquaticus]|uniref:Alpha/beta hydrolase family protein n=1 Tax=Terriglobus aquaticus TaxID=940139 RepID=A0ABW9KGR8_9BACT|nr:alpha/beta fold hydrolase [Terriglobus aquaticus]
MIGRLHGWKHVVRGCLAMCLAVSASTLRAAAPSSEQGRPGSFHAGVQALDIHPGGARNWRGATAGVLHCMVWYPADATATENPQEFAPAGLPPLFHAGIAAQNASVARSVEKLPLVVLSHGLGGSADQFGWLAPALARRGYLVLGVNHPGNNTLEPYTAEGALLWGERAQDVSDAIDGLLANATFGAHVDTARIGAVGYSLGSETVLALAGARVNQQRFFDYCLQHREAATCGIPSVSNATSPAELLAAVRASSAEALAHESDSHRDARIRAVFAMAPPLGEAFSADSFDYVNVPVTLVAGAADTLAPPASNAERFANWLPGAKIAVLQGAGHYTFLDTCTPEGVSVAPQFCQDPPSVNRDAVHTKTAGMVLAFFDRTLQSPAGSPASPGSKPVPSAMLPMSESAARKSLR